MKKLSVGKSTVCYFYSDCVGWPREYADVLDEIANFDDLKRLEDISRNQFLKHVNMSKEESKELIPQWDKHISYYKYGEDLYFYVHSGIEHVFVESEDVLERIQKELEEGGFV